MTEQVYIRDLSVIITCYNEEKFIAEAIDSVFQQTSLEYVKEVLVVDDGSKDNSKQIILEKKKENPLIKYIYQNNKGISSARNTAILNCSGSYIMFLDGDDLWNYDKIKIAVEYIRKFPSAGLFYSNVYEYYFLKNELKPLRINKYYIDQPDLLQTLLAKGGPILPSSIIVKAECFKTVGLFDEDLRMAEDVDMCLRIAAKYSFQFIPEFLIKKRQVDNSLGFDTFENAKYYRKAFNKIENLYPYLKPFRVKREKIINYKVGLYYYKINQFKEARSEAIKSIKQGTRSLKIYLLLISSYLKPAFNFDLIGFLKQVS